MKLLVSIISVLVLATAQSHALYFKPAAKTKILSVRFGVIIATDKEVVKLLETDWVPLVPKTVYGWRIEIFAPKPWISWKEILSLPSKPQRWPDNPETEISADGKTATTVRRVATEKGVVSHFWSIAEGDPSGTYTMEVIVEDELVRFFTFEVAPFGEGRKLPDLSRAVPIELPNH